MDEVTALSALADPTRRQVYDTVAAAAGSVSRDQVVATLGIGRTLAAFHLDKLAEAGLLEFHFVRGPSGGRPAKLYRRSGAEVGISIPPRSYVEAGELLAEALEKAGADNVLQKVARARGRRANASKSMWESLREHGYEPVQGDGEVLLRNCPFHKLAQEFPPLICGMNLGLLTGMAEGAGWPARAAMMPRPGHCCVVLKEDKK